MKITIYELLGLVKDGKAPKEIKFGNIKLKYNEVCEDYYEYYGKGLFEYKFGNCKNFLNDEVEIIEEPKKIKYPILHKTAPSETTGDQMPNWRNLIDCNFEYLNKTICQLIDEINNLKEKKDE